MAARNLEKKMDKVDIWMNLFENKLPLKNHRLKMEQLKQGFKCDFCKKDYKNRHILVQHKKKYCKENKDDKTEILDFKDPLYIIP